MKGHYFTGDRAFWDDDDFPDFYSKYVYSELWQADGIDLIGVRTRNDAIEAARLKLPLRKYKDVICSLDKSGKIKLFDQLIWVKAALWWNVNKGSFSQQQMDGVISRLKSRGTHPIVAEIIGYYSKKYSLPIPYTYPMDTLHCTDTALHCTNTDTDTGESPWLDVPLVVMQSWNSFAESVGLAKINSITEKRKRSIKSRLTQKGFSELEVYDKIKTSKFLLGDNDRGWRCDFDFVWGSPDNWVKILEGKYDSANKSDRAQAEIDAWVKAKQNA